MLPVGVFVLINVMSTEFSHPVKWDIPIIVALFCILFFLTNWIRPLANPDEGRYTEIPREMLESGDWVSPRLNGVLYFDKPPMFYWLQATALKAGGINEFSSRFWTSTFGLLGCIATYLGGRALFGRAAGFFSALVLGTSLLYFAMSQLATLDMTVSVFISSALMVFMRAVQLPPGRKRFWLCNLFFALLALATLTKGLIGLVIPGAIIFWWGLLLWKWKAFWPFYPLTGISIFLIIAVPWHYLAWKAHPEFAWYYFVHEHFLRYVTPIHGRSQPLWFFFVLLPVGLIPWVGFLPQAIGNVFSSGWEKIEENSAEIFLLIWAVLVVLFFSFSDSKLAPYILPAYPPLALLIGKLFSDFYHNKRKLNLKLGVYAFSAIAIVMANATALAPSLLQGRIAPGTGPFVFIATTALFIGGIVSIWSIRKESGLSILKVPFISIFIFYLALNPLAGLIRNDSSKEIVNYLKEHRIHHSEVYSFLSYIQDIAPYYQNTINLALTEPKDQRFGKGLEKDSAVWYGKDEFLNKWNSAEPMYAIAKRKRLKYFVEKNPDWKAFLLKETNKYILISNSGGAAYLLESNPDGQFSNLGLSHFSSAP